MAPGKRVGRGAKAKPKGQGGRAGTSGTQRPSRKDAPRKDAPRTDGPRDPGPRQASRAGRRPARMSEEIVAGRNPVVEALRAGVPAKTLIVAAGIDHDDRVTESLKIAERREIVVREVTKSELDRATDTVHQGIALVVAPYAYAHPEDLLARAIARTDPALLVACDGVTDPRNLGAIVRSAAAFGAHGVVVPERRSAGMTAGAWKASAGAAARLQVAAATNLPRVLKEYAGAGLVVVGLAADGPISLDELEVAVDPLCLVVGSEGRGLGRLVAERCDLLVRIDMPGGTESLNASVAAAVTLHEIARRRRASSQHVSSS